MRFTGAPTGFGAFTVEAAEMPPVAGVADFGLEVGVGEGLTLSAGYRGLFSERLRDGWVAPSSSRPAGSIRPAFRAPPASSVQRAGGRGVDLFNPDRAPSWRLSMSRRGLQRLSVVDGDDRARDEPGSGAGEEQQGLIQGVFVSRRRGKLLIWALPASVANQSALISVSI